MYRSKSNKNVWVLILVMLAGVVVGGLIGEGLDALANNFTAVSFLHWFNYGVEFGLPEPFNMNLVVLSITVGFVIKLTVCGVLGMIAAVLIYRKM